MPAIRSREITYRLCKALKECLCITQALTCIELQGLPLRERDLAALAKVRSIVYPHWPGYQFLFYIHAVLGRHFSNNSFAPCPSEFS